MYKTKYFKLYELLPKEIYKDELNGWNLIDENLLETIDKIREIVGVPLICNNWKFGGKRNYSCVRTNKCPQYNYGSYHSLRNDRKVMAIDVISTKMSAHNMRKLIIENQSKLPYPIRLEDNVNWLHVDVANNKNCKVYLFKA